MKTLQQLNKLCTLRNAHLAFSFMPLVIITTLFILSYSITDIDSSDDEAILVSRILITSAIVPLLYTLISTYILHQLCAQKIGLSSINLSGLLTILVGTLVFSAIIIFSFCDISNFNQIENSIVISAFSLLATYIIIIVGLILFSIGDKFMAIVYPTFFVASYIFLPFLPIILPIITYRHFNKQRKALINSINTNIENPIQHEQPDTSC